VNGLHDPALVEEGGPGHVVKGPFSQAVFAQMTLLQSGPKGFPAHRTEGRRDGGEALNAVQAQGQVFLGPVVPEEGLTDVASGRVQEVNEMLEYWDHGNGIAKARKSENTKKGPDLHYIATGNPPSPLRNDQDYDVTSIKKTFKRLKYLYKI